MSDKNSNLFTEDINKKNDTIDKTELFILSKKSIKHRYRPSPVLGASLASLRKIVVIHWECLNGF